MVTRRKFVLGAIPVSILVLATSRIASSQPARLEESDPAAVALGYQRDASKVNAKTFPTYVAGRNCGACQLFQGKSGEAWGGCAAFGGKLVSSKGWCAAWAKKA